jgi:hypothetical protein
MMRRPPKLLRPARKGRSLFTVAPQPSRDARNHALHQTPELEKKRRRVRVPTDGPLARGAAGGVASSAVAVLGRRARRINSTGTGPRGRCSRSAPAPPPIYYQSSPAGPPPLPAELPARTAHDAHVTTATRHAHKHRQRLRSHATVRSRSATRLCAGRARRTATEVTVRSQQGAGCLRA